MNNFTLNDYSAYIINDTDEGCFISDCHGFFMEAEQMKYLAKRLLETAKAKKSEIEKQNIITQSEYDEIFDPNNSKAKTTEQKPKKEAYVYMLECGGRYKVGFSCDVKRRAAELDNRPFPVNIIATSKATKEAFEIEQRIHRKLQYYKIKGEWYEISPERAEKIAKYINSI